MATTSVLAKLIVAISAQNAEFNRALSSSQKQLLSFQKSIAGVGKVLGAAFGVREVFQGIEHAFGVLAEFETTMSEVKAITGATGDEFVALEKDAKRLGAATKFTATEIGKLQVAFGRLGFNTKEILDATEATLALAAATGEDLAKSADVAGSTVRGFGLSAKETQRVVDVMAKSFNTTALGLDNFTEAMKYVAPVAAAANLSVEETTALLGTLADAGLRGSMAGTALRKILTDLPRDGRPFQQRLEELAKRGITVSDAMDEVGRTAQTALLVLSKNNDKTKELAASFQNVAGEAEKMARVMQDNVTGDVEKLSSAYEGLILKLGRTDVVRRATNSLTALLNALSGTPDEDEGLRLLVRSITENSESARKAFIENLQEIRREAGKPIDLSVVEFLAEKYKLTETQANKLYVSLLEVNEALSFQEKAIKLFNEFAERNGYTDLSKAAEDYKTSLYKLILAEQIHKQQLEQVNQINSDGAFNADIKKADEQIAAYRRIIRIINEYASGFEKSESVVQGATEKTILNLNFYQEALKKLNNEFQGVALSSGEFGKVTEEAASALRILAAEGAGLEDFIKKVERIKESFRDLDVVIKPPDTTALTNALTTIQESAGALTFEKQVTSFEAVIARFEAGLKKLAQKTKETTSEVGAQFIDLTGLVNSALSGIGQALGSALGGGENFGKALLGVLGNILGQLGEMLIAVGVGIIAFNKSLTTLNGPIAIAAGVALVAMASFIGAKIKGLGSSGGAGTPSVSSASSGTSSRSAITSTEAQDVKVVGESIIRGQDLYVIFSNYNNNNKFTRANG